jgi:hypothetical protein
LYTFAPSSTLAGLGAEPRAGAALIRDESDIPSDILSDLLVRDVSDIIMWVESDMVM